MEDIKIVQLFLDRDEKAIDATSKKYGNYCRSIAKNILSKNEDAEECVNDTYLNAWNSIPPHRPKILSTFLGKITRNLALNKFNYYTADKRNCGETPAILDELSDIVSGNANVEGEIDYKELVNAINSFLGELPAEKRKLFVLRYWYLDSVSDIAKRFEMTENNVSVTLNRVRSKLQKYLLERGFKI